MVYHCRPAAAAIDDLPPTLAIEDGATNSDEPVRKKPASKVMKLEQKPSTLDEETVRKRDEEAEQQNVQLNKCIGAAISMMQKSEMSAKRALNDAKVADVKESKKRLRDLHIEELETTIDDLEKHLAITKHIALHKSDLKYTDEKIDALDRAHNLITSAKEFGKALSNLTGKIGTDKQSKKSE